MTKILKIVPFLLGLSLLFNACSEDPVAPPVAPPVVKPITTIADLKSKWQGEDITIADEVYIEGVVTLTPEFKNVTDFVTYIQDETGGIALTLDKTAQAILQRGMKIVVGGSNIPLKVFNGLHQFGNIKFEDGYIQARDVEVTPRVVTLQDVLDKKYIGELVEIKNVEFEKDGTFNGANGNNTLTDCTLRATVYTRSQATFAGEALPKGNGSFVGVISIFNTPQLLVVEPSLLKMDGTRCSTPEEPGGNENSTDVCGDKNSALTSVLQPFEQGEKETAFSATGWRNFSVQGERTWMIKEFGTNKYIQATGHNGTASTYEMWLITPPLDVTNAASKVATFKTAKQYWMASTVFEVYALQCVNGKTIQTKLNPTLATETSADNTFIPSGDIDLSSFNGIVHIGFKYIGEGGASKSTSWRIDDFEFNNTATTVTFSSNPVSSVAGGSDYKYSIATQVVNPVGNTSISATGLPAWASLTDNGDGTALISGTAPEVTEDQTSEVVITATNNAVSKTQSYTLTVKAPGAGGDSDGTSGAPYTVAQAIAKQGETQKFVKGFIVGIVKNGVSTYSGTGDAIFNGTFDSSTNVFIADNPNEEDPLKCINVKLNDSPSSVPTMRNEVNLKDHPENKGKVLIVEGDLKASYTKLHGIRSIKSYKLD